MITVTDLRYTYPRARQQREASPTIKGISFEVAKGEIFGFLGPSGSGKSTTQKILTGILSGYQGTISISGRELSDWDSDYYREIGVGFELPNHFAKLTGLENLQLFASFYGEGTISPEQLLQQMGLAGDANKRVGEYSKGMKMRLNFARAIMHRPKILFLDEPTAGLDPVNARILKRIMRELRDEGVTIFLTTHNMVDAEELCDRVAFLVAGQLATVGKPAELKRLYGSAEVVVEYRSSDSGEIKQASFELHTLGENPDFQALLLGPELLSIHSQEASVEEVFLKATGTELI